MSRHSPPPSSLTPPFMSDGDSISVTDLAARLGKRKQTLFKVIRRLRIEPKKLRSGGHGQLVSYLTASECRLIEADLRSRSTQPEDEGACSNSLQSIPDDQGVFYLLQLEPEQDPGRIKVGFAMSLPERLRALRCSAPFTKVVRTWPCKLLWEKTAIECVTNGCERLHTEVFRTTSVEAMTERCDQFFGLMPEL